MSTIITIKANKNGYVDFTNGGKQRLDTLHQFLAETLAAAVTDNYTDTTFDLTWDHARYVEACQALTRQNIPTKPMRSWKEVLGNLGVMPTDACHTVRDGGSDDEVDEDMYSTPKPQPTGMFSRFGGKAKKKKKAHE